jgi:serine/threonine-protein kinase mTOR
MRVLRQNKESLMAVLEAFVYDPLIGWKLLTPNQKDEKKFSTMRENGPSAIENEESVTVRNKDLQDGETEMPEMLNEKAVNIINRISNKLTGKDFSPKETLSVPLQVNRLIKQATHPENLASAYIGWSPFF